MPYVKVNSQVGGIHGLGMTATQETIFAAAEFGIRAAMMLVIKQHVGEPPAKVKPLIIEAGLTAVSLAGLDRNDPEVKERINRLADALMPSTPSAGKPPGEEKPLIPIIGKWGWKPIALAGGVVLVAYLLTKK